MQSRSYSNFCSFGFVSTIQIFVKRKVNRYLQGFKDSELLGPWVELHSISSEPHCRTHRCRFHRRHLELSWSGPSLMTDKIPREAWWSQALFVRLGIPASWNLVQGFAQLLWKVLNKPARYLASIVSICMTCSCQMRGFSSVSQAGWILLGGSSQRMRLELGCIQRHSMHLVCHICR